MMEESELYPAGARGGSTSCSVAEEEINRQVRTGSYSTENISIPLYKNQLMMIAAEILQFVWLRVKNLSIVVVPCSVDVKFC